MPPNSAADDPIPLDLRADFDRLRLALDEEIPQRVPEQNLLVATWNIHDFGEFSEKWRSVPGDAPRRDLFSLRCIAEIISRFDMLMVQEVTGEARALAELLRLLGENRWGALTSEGHRFHGHREERMAFLYDSHRVLPSGLACELIVLPGEPTLPWDVFARQFTCTPFAASFVSCGCPFILVTAHLRYGADDERRAVEVGAVARWLASWAADEHAVGHNLLLVGDFSGERRGDPCYDAFAACGLHVPRQLQELPREALRSTGGGGFYDQISWFADEGGAHQISFAYRSAGAFDFTRPLAADLRDAEIVSRISDHLPLWVEFGVQ